MLVYSMLFFKRVPALFAAISILLAASSAAAGTLKPVRDPRGRPPAVFLLEGPHLALKTWQEKKFNKKTVIFLGSELGIFPYTDNETKTVLEKMRAGAWDELFEKDYPTSKFYPVGPSTYLYIAWKAGLIEKIYWVPPIKESIHAGSLENAAAALRSLGFEEKSISDIRTSPGSVEARLNGIPVCICGLKDLPRIKGDAVLMVDLSFFTPLYQDEIKTPFLDFFGGFLNILGSRSPKVSSVFISSSTGMGLVPLEFRFAGGYLKAYFKEPGKLKDGPLPEWEFRSRAMYYNTFFQTEEQSKTYSDAVRHSPKDASLHFDLSKASVYLKDITLIKGELDKAVGLDRGYYLQYIEMGRYFTSKGMHADAEVFLKEAEKINPDDPRVYNSLQEMYLSWNRPSDAVKALQKEVSLGFGGPEIYGALGEGFRRLGEYEKAGENYEKALTYIPQVDAKSRASLLLGLADTRSSERKPDEAIKLYEEALPGMPEGHAKERVIQKLEDLKGQWGPFLQPDSPNQAPPGP